MSWTSLGLVYYLILFPFNFFSYSCLFTVILTLKPKGGTIPLVWGTWSLFFPGFGVYMSGCGACRTRYVILSSNMLYLQCYVK